MPTRDTAAEAGISAGGLYFELRNKGEMVQTLSEAARDQTHTDIESRLPPTGPMEIPSAYSAIPAARAA